MQPIGRSDGVAYITAPMRHWGSVSHQLNKISVASRLLYSLPSVFVYPIRWNGGTTHDCRIIHRTRACKYSTHYVPTLSNLQPARCEGPCTRYTTTTVGQLAIQWWIGVINNRACSGRCMFVVLKLTSNNPAPPKSGCWAIFKWPISGGCFTTSCLL